MVSLRWTRCSVVSSAAASSSSLVVGRQAAGDLAEVRRVADLGDEHLADAVHDLRAAIEAAGLLRARRRCRRPAAAVLRTGSDSPVISDWSTYSSVALTSRPSAGISSPVSSTTTSPTTTSSRATVWNAPSRSTLTRSESLWALSDLEFAVALVFAEEGHAGGQDDGDHHRQALDGGRAAARPGRRRTATTAETNSSDGSQCPWRSASTAATATATSAEGDAGRDVDVAPGTGRRTSTAGRRPAGS